MATLPSGRTSVLVSWAATMTAIREQADRLPAPSSSQAWVDAAPQLGVGNERPDNRRVPCDGSMPDTATKIATPPGACSLKLLPVRGQPDAGRDGRAGSRAARPSGRKIVTGSLGFCWFTRCDDDPQILDD